MVYAICPGGVGIGIGVPLVANANPGGVGMGMGVPLARWVANPGGVGIGIGVPLKRAAEAAAAATVRLLDKCLTDVITGSTIETATARIAR